MTAARAERAELDRGVAGDDVVEALNTIGEYLGRPLLLRMAIEPYVDAFVGGSRALFVEACGEWMRTHSPSSMYPSVRDLEAVVRTIRIERPRPRQTVHELQRAVRNEHHQALVDLTLDAIAHRIDRPEFERRMRELELARSRATTERPRGPD